ncbi:hypothetical protein MNBD_GAMMA23-1037 [hydrothermal vent metagenome]|uniref:Uncharacterized protein n=1 Tax=hydrothermal vent metagenome TaxID=652676 RepID=A0A3B0ZZZ5_9ZZZZ
MPLSKDTLKLPTKQKNVQLWVHPSGQVVGSLFIRHNDDGHDEAVLDILNRNEPFVVFQVDMPNEIRFYNRQSIIRIEYSDKGVIAESAQTLYCTIHMMDGTLVEGTIKEALPPEHARLYDYLNKQDNRFLKIYVDDDEVCLINKSYINQVTLPDK